MSSRPPSSLPPIGSGADPVNAAPALIDRSAFAALLSMSESTFDRHRAAGRIGPKPVRIGGCLRWHRAEVEAWLAHRDGRGFLTAVAWAELWARLNPPPHVPATVLIGSTRGSTRPPQDPDHEFPA